MGVQQSTLRVSLLDDFTARSKVLGRSIDSLRAQSVSAFAPMRGLIGQAAALGAGYLGVTQGFSATVGAAIDFESAFADVKKVVDANDEQFENMRQSIRRMSNEIPMAATEIAALFAAAGESGIATEELQQFSEMAARVGIAFDMSAGQAGESLAKLKTQLGLTVAETGDMADAINHLSNNMASKARDITDFMLRVGAFGEIAGFAKEDLAAMGSAMIASGAQSETAATAMLNVMRSLTKGEFAKKSQRDAAKALGLHLPSIAKDMQKDAKGTMRKVLEAIAKVPKDKQVAILSEFFGDEARAFMPLVGNIKLLDQALSSVSDRTKYAGSAFQEYVQRANTTGNVLELLGNKIANVFWKKGDDLLPSIREAALGIGYILDTLDSRVTIFDKMETAVKGFANGFGYDGGIKDFVEDLGDLLVGPIDGNGGDKLGRLFMQAKEWGKSIRELNDAIRDNPMAKFFAEMSGYGFQLFLWGAGIALLAGTIRKLAGALLLLSGASTALSILKTVGQLSEIPGLGTGEGGKGGKSGGGGSKGPGGGNNAPGVLPWAGRMGTWLKGFGSQAALMFATDTLIDTPGDTFDEQVKNQQKYKDGLRKLFGLEKDEKGVSSWDRFWFGKGAEPEFSSRDHFGIRTGGNGSQTALASSDGGSGGSVRIDANSIAEMQRPSGTQDVRVVNNQPPPINVHAPISITGVTDPSAAASQAADALGQAIRDAVSSSYSD